MNPYDKAHELARALKLGDAFTRARNAKDKVEQDAFTLLMIQDFRKRQWELEAKQMMGQQLTEEEQKSFSKLASVIELNQDVREYLQAEYQLSVLMADIQRILADAIKDAMLPEPIGNDIAGNDIGNDVEGGNES